jgi:repressor LexA
MTPMTYRQTEILRWIESFIASRGYPPTLREIGKGVGIASTNGVTDHLKYIERKGWILRHPTLSRALVVVRSAQKQGVTP